MFTAYHEYAWSTEKDHLEFEIGKAEGQLRNCRNRMDLAKREVIICIITFIISSLFFIAWEIYRSVKNNPEYLLPTYSIVSGLLNLIFLFVLSFFTYAMFKAIIFYILCKKKAIKKESLREYIENDKYKPRPEKSYVIEEEKLTRILSTYYHHRLDLYELKRKLEDGELVMTVEALQEELDGLVYYQEIIPASPFQGEMVTKARIWGVIFTGGLLVLVVIVLIIIKIILKVI